MKIFVKISSERHDELLRDQEYREAMELAGVKDWDGYEYAMEIRATLSEERDGYDDKQSVNGDIELDALSEDELNELEYKIAVQKKGGDDDW